MLQIGSDIIPVEVKASENVRSRSLSVYRERHQPKLSIRISMRNFGFEDGIASIPLYAVWLLDKDNLRGLLSSLTLPGP